MIRCRAFGRATEVKAAASYDLLGLPLRKSAEVFLLCNSARLPPATSKRRGSKSHRCELWGETLEMKTGIRPITPLRRLLAEDHETYEKILDEQEIEIDLWAYKKRARGPRRRSASF